MKIPNGYESDIDKAVHAEPLPDDPVEAARERARRYGEHMRQKEAEAGRPDNRSAITIARQRADIDAKKKAQTKARKRKRRATNVWLPSDIAEAEDRLRARSAISEIEIDESGMPDDPLEAAMERARRYGEQMRKLRNTGIIPKSECNPLLAAQARAEKFQASKRRKQRSATESALREGPRRVTSRVSASRKSGESSKRLRVVPPENPTPVSPDESKPIVPKRVTSRIPPKRAEPKKEPETKVEVLRSDPVPAASAEEPSPRKKRKRTQTRMMMAPVRNDDHMMEKLKRLDLIHSVAKEFVGSLNLNSLMHSIFEQVTDVLHAEAGSLWLVDDDKVICQVAAGPDTENLIGLALPVGTGIVGYSAAKGESVIIHDASKDPRFSKAGDRRTGFQTRSLISVPLMDLGGKALGVFEVINRKEGDGQFSDDDMHMLEDLATYAAISIRNARLYASQARVEALSAMMEVSSEMTSTLDIDSVIVTVVNGSSKVAEFERAAIALEDNGKARLMALSGVASIDASRPENKGLQSVLEYLLSRKQDLWVPDCHEYLEDDQCPKIFKSYVRNQGIKGFWAKVLKDEEGVLGIFAIEAAETDFMSEQQREVLGILGNQSTVAIRNAQLYHKVPFVSFFEKVAGKDSAWSSMSIGKRIATIVVLLAFSAILFVIPNPYTSVGGDFVASASQKRTLYAPIEGQIAQVFVEKGDVVEKGDKIVRFVSRQKVMELNAKIAERENARLEINEATGIAGIKARNRLERLEKEIELLSEEVERATVRSPIAGIVVTDDMRSFRGKLLRESDEICEIEDHERLSLDIAVEEKDIRFIRKVGNDEGPQSVTFKASAYSDPFQGFVTKIAPIGEEQGEFTVFKVRVDIANPPADGGDKLLPGMTGTARIDVESRTLFSSFLHWMNLR